MLKWLTTAFKKDAKPAPPPQESPFRNLHEAQHLAETFFQSQGNPEKFAISPKDLTTLFTFAVIAGRKMEGMPSGAITEDVAKEIGDYAWGLTGTCFKAAGYGDCQSREEVLEKMREWSIVLKRPDLAQDLDEDLLIPLLTVCVSKGREIQVQAKRPPA